MTINSDAVLPAYDMPLELQKIISRMSRDHRNPAEMLTLGEAATRLIPLEQVVRNLLGLMEDTPYPELHVSVRQARTIVDGYRN